MSYVQEPVAILSALGTAASFLSLSAILQLEVQSKAVKKVNNFQGASLYKAMLKMNGKQIMWLLMSAWAPDSKTEATNLYQLVVSASFILLSSLFVGTSISLNNKVAKDSATARLCWASILLAAGFCTVAGATAAELFLVFLPPFISISLGLGSLLGSNFNDDNCRKTRSNGIYLV